MEKLYRFAVLIFSVFMLSSCNDRFEGDEITNIEQLKIDSVTIPQDTMEVYSTQTIKTYSNFTTKCEGFYGYDYIHTDELSRSVSSFKFKPGVACGEEVARAAQINFRPQMPGNYVFKFWNGKDAAGENTWIEKTIVVQ